MKGCPSLAQLQLGPMASDMLQEGTGLLFPAPALSPPRITPNSSNCKLLIQHIMEAVRPGRSVIQERSQGLDTAHGWTLRFPSVRSVSKMAAIGRHGRAWVDGIILREKGDGPGGRVNLPDHRRSWCN